MLYVDPRHLSTSCPQLNPADADTLQSQASLARGTIAAEMRDRKWSEAIVDHIRTTLRMESQTFNASVAACGAAAEGLMEHESPHGRARQQQRPQPRCWCCCRRCWGCAWTPCRSPRSHPCALSRPLLNSQPHGQQTQCESGRQKDITVAFSECQIQT